MTRVLFVAAMDRECAGLRRYLGAVARTELPGGFTCWMTDTLAVIQTHVGEVNAALAASAAIAHFQPDAVVKLGCVGGHTAGLHTGDLVLPTAFFHSGAWLTRDHAGVPTPDARDWLSLFGELPFQVNAENLGGRPAVFAPDLALTTQIARVLTSHGFAAKRAAIGSSAMWFFDRDMMQHVVAAQMPDVPTQVWAADMESHAVAQTCAALGVPCSGVYRLSNSEYYAEPYLPGAIASLFDGAFVAALVRAVSTW
jgi:nucleoside phosphorylase